MQNYFTSTSNTRRLNVAYQDSAGSTGGADTVAQNTTIITKKVPGNVDASMPGRGTVKLLTVWAGGVGAMKVKIFRDDGTNYVFLGEYSFTSAAGINTIPAWIPVEKGDLIALYHNTVFSLIRYEAGNPGDITYQAGDITTTTAKTAWSSGSIRLSVKARIHSRPILL